MSSLQTNQRVVIAMSGGVDSSVAAALLVKEGYEVIGMMLRLWSEPGSESDNRCCTPEAMALARRVAARLGIPFYAIDAQQIFHDTVVQYFLDGYAQQITPNPCLVCNRRVRWGVLLDQALALGAHAMATGHYARLRRAPDGTIQLLRAVDMAKDQSYVLHVLDQEKLALARFPLGEYTKVQVRQLARDFDLPVAERSDSQDLCFLGGADYRDFLRRHVPAAYQPGPILSQAGKQIGQHQGLAFYTIGQRKGLGIAAPHPLYVLKKDSQRNALIVAEAAALGQNRLVAGPVHWIADKPPAARFRAQVKIRYKALPAWVDVEVFPAEQVQVRFDQPMRDITPGQAAVFYDGDTCLGGGLIQS